MLRVTFTQVAREQFDRLPMQIRSHVMNVAAALERWPQVSGAKPLRGRLPGRYRKRTGDYRVQFYVRTEMIIIEHVGHRDGFYDE